MTQTVGAGAAGRFAEPLLSLWVAGRPRPKGSLKPVGNRYRKGPVRLIEGGAEIDAWMTTMRNTIQSAVSEPCAEDAPGAVWLKSVGQWRRLIAAPYQGPVAVQAVFAFERRYATEAGAPYPTNPIHGDLDKLCRALGDALQQAGVIRDDNQIVHWWAGKAWSTGGAGVSFDVRAEA